MAARPEPGLETDSVPSQGHVARLPNREAGWEVGHPKDGGRIEKLEPLPRGPEGFGRARDGGGVLGRLSRGDGKDWGRQVCSSRPEEAWRGPG